jgi:hypothetical protein
MKGFEIFGHSRRRLFKQSSDGVPVICRKAGISQATYVNWKRKYVGCCRVAVAEATRGRGREAPEGGS